MLMQEPADLFRRSQRKKGGSNAALFVLIARAEGGNSHLKIEMWGTRIGGGFQTWATCQTECGPKDCSVPNASISLVDGIREARLTNSRIFNG